MDGTYIFVENIEIWVCAPLVLRKKIYAHNTFKSCLKGHLLKTMLIYSENPLCTLNRTHEPMGTYLKKQDYIQYNTTFLK